MKRQPIVGIFLGLALLLGAQANAQTVKRSGATLTGTVLGADGKSVPNAAISCESSGGLHPRAVHADAKGKFVITGLKQDSYDLRASGGGAYSDWERNIPLRLGKTKDVTLRLSNGNTALVGTPLGTPHTVSQKP
jgi:Carboxypeptidase regulatory-like domain